MLVLKEIKDENAVERRQWDLGEEGKCHLAQDQGITL